MASDLTTVAAADEDEFARDLFVTRLNYQHPGILAPKEVYTDPLGFPSEHPRCGLTHSLPDCPAPRPHRLPHLPHLSFLAPHTRRYRSRALALACDVCVYVCGARGFSGVLRRRMRRHLERRSTKNKRCPRLFFWQVPAGHVCAGGQRGRPADARPRHAHRPIPGGHAPQPRIQCRLRAVRGPSVRHHPEPGDSGMRREPRAAGMSVPRHNSTSNDAYACDSAGTGTSPVMLCEDREAGRLCPAFGSPAHVEWLNHSGAKGTS